MKKAFTLIELLVVIAIIAILAAILFPVFTQAKLAAKKTAALSQMKQLSLAVFMYSTDNDDYMAPASNRTGVGDPIIWPGLVNVYAKNKDIFQAPDSRGTFADVWVNRKNQSVGYTDASGVDPLSTAVEGAALPGTEGFTNAANFSQAEESASIGLFAVTPNGANAGSGKERGYVFNPYNGPTPTTYSTAEENYKYGLPLIADVNIVTTPYKGVNYTTLSAGALKPIFARYGGNGQGDGQTPVIFADGHAKMYSANSLNQYGKVIWRFR
ncbi:MAG: prepilin-type N-terminal cleavage/methylation domain-containing protein [Chthonomonas sp.]|nr:prepilin-type N-terminal cleavage/methylation domain-containing protein [Chthonomonas sp.]